MSRDQAAGLVLALAIHFAALFSFRISQPPATRPIGEDPVEVSLVAAPENKPVSKQAPVESVASPESPPSGKSSVATPAESPPPIAPPEPAPVPKGFPKPKLAPASGLPKTKPPKEGKPRENPSSPRANAATSSKESPQTRPGARLRSGAEAAVERGDAAPDYRNNPQPEYPPEARQSEQQGLVMLDVLVSANGRAAKVSIVRSSGFRILDQAAAAAVRRWTFQPGRAAGIAVAAHVTVPVRFRLER